MSEIKRCQMLIDGDWVGASDGAVFPSVSPVTGAVWAQVPEATAADVDRAVRYGFGFGYVGAGPVGQKEISGLDVSVAAAKSLYPDLCNDDGPPQFLIDMVNRGECGMKAGKGFRVWDDKQIDAERTRYAKALKAALAT